MPEISFKDAVRNWVEATNELESYKSNPEYYRTKEGSYFLLVGDEIDDDNTHLKRIVEAIEPSEETDFVRRWQRTELCYKKIKMEKFKSATKFALDKIPKASRAKLEEFTHDWLYAQTGKKMTDDEIKSLLF